MICIFHLLFPQLCDMESHCVIHIQILFKSVAPHLHLKLRIWSQVACILIRGTTFIWVRVDIANKWDRVLIIVMKGVLCIVHCNKVVCSPHVMNLISSSTHSAQEMIIFSSNRVTQSWCHSLEQNYPQNGGLFRLQKTFYICTLRKNQHIMICIKGIVTFPLYSLIQCISHCSNSEIYNYRFNICMCGTLVLLCIKKNSWTRLSLCVKFNKKNSLRTRSFV